MGHTRVLVPIPGTNCKEYDYIIACNHTGELLDQDNVSLKESSTSQEFKEQPDCPPCPALKKKRNNRRISMHEKVLPLFELHGEIIKFAQDHFSWTSTLMREYPPEYFLQARKYTHDSRFFHGAMGECAARFGCFIEPITEECMIDDVAPTSAVPSEEGCEYHDVMPVVDGMDNQDYDMSICSWDEEEDLSVKIGGNIILVTTTVMTAAAKTSATATATHASVVSTSSPTDDGSASADLVLKGSGYRIDGKGRKRRFSLHILQRRLTD